MNTRRPTESTPLKESTMIEIEPIHPLEIQEIVYNISTHLSYCTYDDKSNRFNTGDLANLRMTSRRLNDLVENTPAGQRARQAYNAEYYGNIASYTLDAIGPGALAGAVSGGMSPIFSVLSNLITSSFCEGLRCSTVTGLIGGGISGGLTGSIAGVIQAKDTFTGIMASLSAITIGSGFGSGAGALWNTEGLSPYTKILVWSGLFPSGFIGGVVTGALVTGATVGVASSLGMFAKQKIKLAQDIRNELTKPIALEEPNVTPRFK